MILAPIIMIMMRIIMIMVTMMMTIIITIVIHVILQINHSITNACNSKGSGKPHRRHIEQSIHLSIIPFHSSNIKLIVHPQLFSV